MSGARACRLPNSSRRASPNTSSQFKDWLARRTACAGPRIAIRRFGKSSRAARNTARRSFAAPSAAILVAVSRTCDLSDSSHARGN
eukprot:2536156-Pyramimonas_sp.AAC.1